MPLCSSGKRIYTTEASAVDALLEAHIEFTFRKGTGPVTIYKCEACGNYHLTSKGTMHTTLAEALQNGKLTALRRGREWEQKVKK
ncbi:MAG: hypothetical protein KF775_14085 [Cyclobacteriaceae bacterium]|nr:hypothetical protein [Cyclobacteriaceae bacterium]